MKKFSELKPGDTLYFLIDTCGILQECGYPPHSSVGFANPNYGLVVASRTIVSDRWDWHNPRTDNGLLCSLRVDKPIMRGNRCLFGPHINEYGLKTDSLISVTRSMGEKSCLTQNFGWYPVNYGGYVFTTKEELESKVRKITDVVESNLNKINEDLNNL